MAIWENGIAKISLPTPLKAGDVNVFLMKGDCLTLIDAGLKTEEAWRVFRSELATLQLKPDDIEQVLLTHHHVDHIGFLERIGEKPVWAHPRAKGWLLRDAKFWNEYRDFYRKLFQQFAVPERSFRFLSQMEKVLELGARSDIAGFLMEGMEVPGLPGWRVMETPGHASSHICFFHEKSGILIGGDLLLASTIPNPLLEPPFGEDGSRPKPILLYNDSLARVAACPIVRVLAGHGDDIFMVSEFIEKRMKIQHEQAMKVKMILGGAGEPLPVFEVTRRLYPVRYEEQLYLTLSKTVGHLDYLEAIGEIEAILLSNGQILYRTL
jgi:Metallo-beta-lactamase superfamily.